MKLLATTSRSFLRLDPREKSATVLHSGDGLYYGVAVAPDRIFVAARRRMVSSDAPPEGEAGVIHVFDHACNHVQVLVPPFPLRDVHEISFEAGVLWVTCSFDDMVAIWDGVDWSKWYPLGEPVGEIRDIHHFNSFYFEQDTIWLLAHNRGPSQLLAFARSGLALLHRIECGWQAHNIWREAGHFYTCSSAEGQIVSDGGFRLQTGGFPRGYLKVGATRFVGISELAERQARDFTSCTVNCYDDQWNFRDTLVLEGEGLLLDLAVVTD